MGNTSDEERYREARQRVQDIKGFYTHLAVYIVINAMLIAINLISSPGGLWFYWVTIFWGIGIAFHALDVFVFKGKYMGKEWEEKKIRKYMDDDSGE